MDDKVILRMLLTYELPDGNMDSLWFTSTPICRSAAMDQISRRAHAVDGIGVIRSELWTLDSFEDHPS